MIKLVRRFLQQQMVSAARHRIRAFYHARSHIWQHTFKNVAIGLAVDLLIIPALHVLIPGPFSTMENLGLDGVTALEIYKDPQARSLKKPPDQLFVDVDDASWRNPIWGGGEPDRAPRDRLFDLVEMAFNHDAAQVVLDVLIEGNNATPSAENAADTEFAKKLFDLLGRKKLDNKQLILVRSLRHPLPQLVDTNNMFDRFKSEPFSALNEIRGSYSLDDIIKGSNGKVAVAAPYFVYSADRVLREWELVNVVCDRDSNGKGTLRVLPSVQLLVAAKYVGVNPEDFPAQPEASCEPFPQQGSDTPIPSADMSRSEKDLKETTERVSKSYLKSMNLAVYRARVAAGLPGRDFGAASFQEDSLSNRVIFRGDAGPDDKYFHRVPASFLLDGTIPDSRLHDLFKDRIVTIGQSFAEAGDQHYTPVGQIPGSVVLLNAIDSIVRYPLIQPVDWKVEKAISFVLILLVGYIFARWDSLIGPLVSIAIAVPIVFVVSFAFFTYGLWFDLVLPILAILLHREYKIYEEHRDANKV